MSENREDGFYKGLVFGALLAAGMMWLLSTRQGKEIARSAKRKIEDVFEGSTTPEDIEEISDQETVPPEEIYPSIPVASAVHHRRFFKRKKK